MSDDRPLQRHLEETLQRFADVGDADGYALTALRLARLHDGRADKAAARHWIQESKRTLKGCRNKLAARILTTEVEIGTGDVTIDHQRLDQAERFLKADDIPGRFAVMCVRGDAFARAGLWKPAAQAWEMAFDMVANKFTSARVRQLPIDISEAWLAAGEPERALAALPGEDDEQKPDLVLLRSLISGAMGQAAEATECLHRWLEKWGPHSDPVPRIRVRIAYVERLGANAPPTALSRLRKEAEDGKMPAALKAAAYAAIAHATAETDKKTASRALKLALAFGGPELRADLTALAERQGL